MGHLKYLDERTTYVLKINTIFILQGIGLKKNQESLYTFFKYREGEENGKIAKFEERTRKYSLLT